MTRRKIYVWISNGIGNLIQMTPSLQACNEEGFEVHVGIDSTFNRHRPLLDIVLNCPFIDQVVRYPEDNFLPEIYEKVIYFGTQEKGVIPNIIQELPNKMIYPKLGWTKSKIHETSYFMKMAYDLGYVGKIPWTYCPIDQCFFLDPGKRISISIGCWDGMKNKKWIESKWADLIKSILFFYEDIEVCFVGGIGEKEETNRIIDNIQYGKDRIKNYAGVLNILQSAKVVKESDITLSVDSSIAHISAAVGTYLVVLFGPTLISKNRPFSDNISILSADMECSPCQETNQFWSCPNNLCMSSIDPGDVFNEIRRYLKS